MTQSAAGERAVPAIEDPAPITDESLVERLRDGDRAALGAIMDRHAAGVLGFIARYIGDRGWAEDLAQETFLAVYRGAGTFRPGARFTPWLYRIARNLSIDFARRRSAGRRAALAAAAPEAASSSRESELQDALLAVPEKLRGALVLVEIQGLSYEDAAEALGCSPKTLSSRLTRGRARLRRLLHGESP